MQEFLPIATVGIVKQGDICNPAIKLLANIAVPAATVAAIITALYSAFESKVDDKDQAAFQTEFFDLFVKIFDVRDRCIDSVSEDGIIQVGGDDE